MTGTHVVEECPELDQWRPRRAVWKDWGEDLGGRAAAKKKKKEEEEEEGDLLGAFFFRIYEFLYTFSNPPPVIHRPRVPERYAIKFVPARSVNPVMPSVLTSSLVPPFSPPAISAPSHYASSFIAASSVNVSSLNAFDYPTANASSSFNAHAAVPTSSAVSASSLVSTSSVGFSIISSTNFVPPSMFTSTSCIDTTQ